MREIITPQLQLGARDIGAIEVDCKSRDDIPRLLRGLQSIYVAPEVRGRVFAILAEVVPLRSDGTGAVSTETGRPGMTQWQMLVLGMLRLGLNADYDRIEELANQHRTVRQMLGHSDWAEEKRWSVQTLEDILRPFTPEVLDRINQVVVDAGHALVKKSPEDALAVRADSFVVETDVHFPTDINLLCDAVREVIETSAGLSAQEDLIDWRQSAYNVRCWKKAYRRVQQLTRSTAKDENTRAARSEAIKQAHRDYLELAEQFLQRAWLTRSKLHIGCRLPEAMFSALDDDIAHAEKVFSIFEPHTEWISKGKAGVPVEFGLRVSVSEDQYGFILSHRVMQHETDDQVAVPLVADLTARFPTRNSVSFDKGFHSPANQQRLLEMIELPVLPKKGKCSPTEYARTPSGFPIPAPAPPRYRVGHQCAGGARPGPLPRSWHRRLQALRRAGCARAQPARLGAILIAQDAEQEQCQRKRAA